MSDWWARKLGGDPVSTSPTPVTRPPVPPSYNPALAAPRTPVQYNASQDRVAVSKAQHTRNESYCPECGSGNYMKTPGSDRYRCYDCGYPIQQSGSGAAGPTNPAAPAQPAQQIASPGFQPNSIQGHIQ